MARDKYVTIMFIPQDGDQRRAWRVRPWVLKGFGITLGTLVVGIVLFFVFYGKVLSRALMTEQVMAENEDLRKYRYKVQLLEQKFEEMRTIVDRVADLAGIDIALPPLPDDSALFARIDRGEGASLSRPANVDWTLPVGLPINGFVTQRFDISDSTHYHPGVDIACAEGTPVLATGSGRVTFAGFDSTYGYMVIIQHNDSVSTVYGHNDSLLVTVGQQVSVGSRIALSGNTGKSTAPHVHYELRINDKPINPLENPYD